jgi:hypothetical protein
MSTKPPAKTGGFAHLRNLQAGALIALTRNRQSSGAIRRPTSSNVFGRRHSMPWAVRSRQIGPLLKEFPLEVQNFSLVLYFLDPRTPARSTCFIERHAALDKVFASGRISHLEKTNLRIEV